MNKYYVGIYLRLSSEDIDEYNCSESIKNQRNLLINEIKKRDNFILVDEYCDEDLSGAGTFRPQFERLIRDCEIGRINTVMCKSQSRFSRDMEVIEKYLHNKFIEWNVRFIGVADYADTEVLGNKKARQINGLVNEWYLEDVSNNIRSAFYAKMLRGELIAPFAPFGYKILKYNNNQLVIDKWASLIVKKIFQLYLEGYGYSSIVCYLNKNHIPSPSYYKYLNGSKLYINSLKSRDKIIWNINAVKSILTNQVYIGDLVQGKRTTVSYKNHKIKKKNSCEWITSNNTHEAIIDRNTFFDVQKCIKERKKVIHNTGRIHIFSGKVFCNCCGNIMRKKNSNNHQYLVCSGYYLGVCDNKKSIRYDMLERIILSNINRKMNNFYSDELLINYNNSFINKKNELYKMEVNIKNRIAYICECFRNLYDDKVNNNITFEQFKNLSSSYNNELVYYKKNLDIINQDINNRCDKINIPNSFSRLNSMTVQRFIKSIYIGNIYNEYYRDIIINWNY